MLGQNLDDIVSKKMALWLQNNPKHMHGIHKYSPNDYGLNEKIVSQYFARFDTKSE
jgi:hypothetical protein